MPHAPRPMLRAFENTATSPSGGLLRLILWSTYVFKKGFLDGAVGFHFALHKAIYFYQIRVKVRAAEAARGLL